jgi:hypothetical protein
MTKARHLADDWREYMRNRRLFFVALVALLVCTSFLPNKSLAKWAYPFVVWDGYIYVISDEYVEEVDKKIGRVTKYNDMEGTYSGNFSNEYKKGTAYYSITGVSTDEAIAIEDGGGKYKKAIRDGEYEGNKYSLGIVVSIMIVGFIALLLLRILLANYKRKK